MNVLLIITEDHGAQMGVYGTPGLSTPNMDALAAAGARYEQAYVTMGSCTTSKASLMTGRYNHLIGVTANVQEFVGSYQQLQELNPSWLQDRSSEYYRYAIPDAVPTLIERLWDAGYFLGLQNKLHQSPHWKFPYDLWYVSGSGNSDGQVADFIAKAVESGRPWFLLHNIGNTHRPWPDSASGEVRIDPAELDIPAHLPDTEVVRADYAEYLQSVENADRRIGLALQALRNSGQADRTFVVLLGDNGLEYHRGKYTTYRLGLQVPLILAGPDIPAAQLRRELFSGVDLMPTLLELLGLPLPEQLDGVSHAALLTGRDSVAPRQYALGNTLTDRSITDGRYQLIFMPNPADTFLPDDLRLQTPWRNPVYDHVRENAGTRGFERAYRLLDLADASIAGLERPRFELYDLQADPWEVNDLAPQAGYGGVLESLRLELCRQMMALQDPGPLPAPCP